jgi:capsular exopolysaccharide synthesis family protein
VAPARHHSLVAGLSPDPHFYSAALLSQQALLITSPRPEDGKTATAINLAVTFAQGNQRVLLIDCNFRRQGIRSAFPNTRPEGLSNVLVAHRTLDEVITQTDLANLDVMTSGPMPPNPAELLGSTAMRDLLTAAKGRYDRLILDGPPCLLISDAMVLATQVDATVMVARAANSAKGALRRAREQFQRINARIIGVLSGVQVRPGILSSTVPRVYSTPAKVSPGTAGRPSEIDLGPLPNCRRTSKSRAVVARNRVLAARACAWNETSNSFSRTTAQASTLLAGLACPR